MRSRSAVLTLSALLAASFPVTARAAGPFNVVTTTEDLAAIAREVVPVSPFALSDRSVPWISFDLVSACGSAPLRCFGLPDSFIRVYDTTTT